MGIIWLFGTAFGVIVFPLWEGRESIVRTARLMALDAMGRKRAALEGRSGSGCEVEAEESTPSGVATPTEKVVVKRDAD